MYRYNTSCDCVPKALPDKARVPVEETVDVTNKFIKVHRVPRAEPRQEMQYF